MLAALSVWPYWRIVARIVLVSSAVDTVSMRNMSLSADTFSPCDAICSASARRRASSSSEGWLSHHEAENDGGHQ